MSRSKNKEPPLFSPRDATREIDDVSAGDAYRKRFYRRFSKGEALLLYTLYLGEMPNEDCHDRCFLRRTTKTRYSSDLLRKLEIFESRDSCIIFIIACVPSRYRNRRPNRVASLFVARIHSSRACIVFPSVKTSERERERTRAYISRPLLADAFESTPKVRRRSVESPDCRRSSLVVVVVVAAVVAAIIPRENPAVLNRPFERTASDRSTDLPTEDRENSPPILRKFLLGRLSAPSPLPPPPRARRHFPRPSSSPYLSHCRLSFSRRVPPRALRYPVDGAAPR